MTVTIIVGDVLDELRKMADDSVHMCFTSPPYYGKRQYGIEPSVWGGDPACAHRWGEELLDRSKRSPGTQGGSLTGDGRYQAEACRFEIRSNFCVDCGAWRGELGLEPTPDLYVEHIVAVFEEVRRVLRPDGTLWLNLGDSYATGAGAVGARPGGGEQGDAWAGQPRDDVYHRGYRGERLANGRADQSAVMRRKTRSDRDGSHAGIHTAMTAIGPMTQPNRMPLPGLKPKDLIGIPWMAAFALRRAGWWLRGENIWHKPNPMPESTTDRCTSAHEQVFLLAKRGSYFYDAVAVAEPANYAPGSGWEDEAKGTRPGKRSAVQESALDPEQSFRAIRETRNKRTVWTLPTAPFPEAHFATFPPALVTTGILAGTSAKGCCRTCLAPWDRVTGKVDTGRTQKMPDGMATHAGGHDSVHRDGREKGQGGNPVLETVTLGWWPGCRCDGFDATLPPYPRKPSRAEIDDERTYKSAFKAWLDGCQRVNDWRREMCEAVAGRPTRPCIALDIFGGAGTTGLVADRLQRDALLIERKPEYAEMARRRIDDEAGLFAARAAE